MLSRDWQRVIQMIGQAVYETRTLLGWSQCDLAKRAGVSQGAISRLEHGRAGDAPLRSVLGTLLALAVGAETAKLSVPAAAHGLLTFAQTFQAPIKLTAVDQDLLAFVRAFHRLPPERRAAVLRFIDAVVDLFGAKP